MMKSIVILLSGNGSNCQSIIEAARNNHLPAQISAIISDEPEAYGLIRAQKENIPHHCLNPRHYPSSEQFDEALALLCQKYQPTLIVLAGFMRFLGPNFTIPFQNRILNIHPSLLPKYKGLNTHQRVLDAKEIYHGCTVHLVDNTLDGGPILAQASLSVTPNDTTLTLKKRVQALEHQLYPSTICDFLTQF